MARLGQPSDVPHGRVSLLATAHHLQESAFPRALVGNREAAAEILSRDLPKASVEDNLRYYDIQRELMSRPTSAQPAAPSAIPTAQMQTTRLK